MHNQIKDSFSSLACQIATLIIGLIIPQMMIRTYGSELNGLASSISQFLSYATLIEGGIGGATRAILYKAFSSNNNQKIGEILKTTESFFRKVAVIFIIYVALLAIIYPHLINSSFDAFFTGSLVCIIAVSTFLQYCFGVTYSIFLQADRKLYIINTLQVFTIILNAVVTIILINLGAPFHFVKLASTTVFVLRPVFLNWYVKKNYVIDKNVKANKFLLPQRWNSMAHHIAWFLHSNTDIVIITLFGILSDVSVYSIYMMIASSMTKFAGSSVSGMEALFGNLLANPENNKKATYKFSEYTMIMNSTVILLFSTAGIMLMPFISLYTSGISDANYEVPLLGYMLLFSEALYCLRIPYHSIVTAIGHFKQTQISAILEVFINIILSIILINLVGLPGVAIATAVAMMYRTIYYIFYLSKNIMHISFLRNLFNIFFAMAFSIAIIIIRQFLIPVAVNNYAQWIFQAIISFVFASLGCLLYITAFYKNEFINLTTKFKNKIFINRYFV